VTENLEKFYKILGTKKTQGMDKQDRRVDVVTSKRSFFSIRETKINISRSIIPGPLSFFLFW